MIVRHPSLKWLPCAKEHKVIPQSSRRFYLGSSTSTHSQVVAALVFGFSCGRGPLKPRLPLCAVNDELPSDAELMKSLNARLPPEVRLNKERALRAEETLRKADEAIKALGIDLTAAAPQERQLLPKPAGAQAVLCWLSQDEPGPATLHEALQARMGEVIREALDPNEMHGLSAEDFGERLAGCSAVAVHCPSALDAALQAKACLGLTALMEGAPESMKRIVLVSDSRAATAVERHLTKALRERSQNASPIRLNIIRAMLASTGRDEELPVQVIAKMPATVRDAARGLRSSLVGGVRSAVALAEAFQELSNDWDAIGSETSPEVLAVVLDFALQIGLDVPEVTVAGQAEGSDFEELLLPLVGPELWRLEVPNARRARAWVRGWVEFNYCRGANQNGAAMKKVGLKTPVEVRQTSLGSCIKFLPPGSRQPGAGFDGLLEGGLEILVDDATTTRPARMRVRRCAYGWRKKPRESSERAILSRLRKDWELSEKLRS